MDEADRRKHMEAAIASEPVGQPARDLEEVYRAHSELVFRAAYRVTGSESDAEDVLQSVFMRLLQRPDSPIANLAAYLHRSAVNASLSLLRARHGRDVPLQEVESHLSDSPLQPDRRHDRRELRACLRRAIARLSPKAAEIFALRYLEGYGNREIAGMLDISQTTVAVTLFRSRERLQQQIRSSLGEPL
jgi:RNA polymerase sigma-70 factor (ECF subfamily)